MNFAYTKLLKIRGRLREFNVLADRGKEEGRIYRHRGLVYRILDEKGEKVGVPIKASSLAGKPTLEALQVRFAVNKKRREVHKASLIEKMDACLSTAPSSLQELIETMGKKGVFTLPRRNAEGRLYGITFVDNGTRCVFNGSDLGKGCTAAAIQARLAAASQMSNTTSMGKSDEKKKVENREQQKAGVSNERSKQFSSGSPSELLLAPRPAPETQPFELLKKKKKRKKRTPGI